MGVRKKIAEPNGVFFITFTCARWLPLLQLTEGYDAVYKWFDYLKAQKHYIVAYVLMPSHVHVMIAFSDTRTAINTIAGNGKRFIAYDLVKRLEHQGKKEILEQLGSWVNKTELANTRVRSAVNCLILPGPNNAPPILPAVFLSQLV